MSSEPAAGATTPPPTSTGSRGGLALTALAAAFVLSGAASLMDQVVWLRYLSLSFGNTTWATATLLAVFMGGLGGGALLFGRLADRARRPLLWFVGIEIAVALFALASPTVLGLIDHAYVAVYQAFGNQPLLFTAGRTFLAALFLLPPTLLMGATLPLMLRGAIRELAGLGRTSALLYGVNTVGAVLGTAVAGFVTIRLIGLYGTLVLAAGLDLFAALIALPLSRPLAVKAPVAPAPVRAAAAPPQPKTTRARGRAGLLALFFAMGATSLAYEVLWTRVLVFYLGSSVYAYSLMLVLVLSGIGLGSLLAAPWADRVRNPLLGLAVVQLLLALWAAAQVALFRSLNELLLIAAQAVAPTGFEGIAVAQLLAVAPVLGPATLMMGISFPLAVKALAHRAEDMGGDVGRVYGWNTLGAVAGALLAGFALIPLVGTQNALLLTGAVNGALAAGLFLTQASSRVRWAALATPAVALAAIPYFPPDSVILSAGIFGEDRPGDLLHFHEDAQASVTIRRRTAPEGDYLSLELNGVNVAGTSPDLYAIQKMQGHLPMLLSQDPRSVVHIGFGSGGTAWAVSRHPVAEILIVEISPAVLAASDRFFPHINHGVLADPRVRVEVNDGRNYVLASRERFDAVLSDSIHPRFAGNGSLYSLEYFRLLRERLEPGGVASMWLPMYSLTPRNYAMILEAFRQVFPEVAVWYEPSTLNSFTIVTGKVAGPPWDGQALHRRFSDPRIASELADLGIRRPADLLPLLLATGKELDPWLRQVPPHEDDVPAVEYESGTLTHRDVTWLMNFDQLLALRPEQPPTSYLEALDSNEQPLAVLRYQQRRQLLDEHREALLVGLRSALLGIPPDSP